MYSQLIPKSGRQSQPCVQRIQSVRICLYSPESGREPQPCVRRIWTVRILQCSPLCPEDPECPDPPVESLVYMGDSSNPVSGGFGLSGSYSAVMSLGDSLSPVSRSSCTILSLGALCPDSPVQSLVWKTVPALCPEVLDCPHPLTCAKSGF